MENNRNNFKPGNKKPFSRDSRNSGNSRDGSDRRYGSPYKSNNYGRPNNFSGKSNYSSDRDNRNNQNNNRYDKNKNSGEYGRFNKSDKNDRFDRNDRPFEKKSGRPFERKFDKPFDRERTGEKTFDRSERPERKFERRPGGPGFNKFTRNKSDDNKKFNGDRKFDKSDRFDRFDRFDKNERFGNNKNSDKYNNFNKFNKTPEKENTGDAAPAAIVEQENSGLVYGRNAVIELLKSGKSVDKLFVQSGQREGSITMIFSEAVKKGIPVIEVEKAKLDSMINNSAHQGVIAMASEKEYCSVDDILDVAADRGEKPFILIADKIMDPHNLGAIIRTAECAGIHGIIIPKRNAAGVSPIVTKTSAGASIHMAIAKVANIANTLSELKEKGVWIFASALETLKTSELNKEADGVGITEYDAADYDVPLAFVVGNEGEGLSPIIIQKSDFLVKIPLLGEIDSLNVSCASAVLIYEAARQRKNKNKQI